MLGGEWDPDVSQATRGGWAAALSNAVWKRKTTGMFWNTLRLKRQGPPNTRRLQRGMSKGLCPQRGRSPPWHCCVYLGRHSLWDWIGVVRLRNGTEQGQSGEPWYILFDRCKYISTPFPATEVWTDVQRHDLGGGKLVVHCWSTTTKKVKTWTKYHLQRFTAALLMLPYENREAVGADFRHF